MEIRKVLVLRGPNIWARFPVLEAWVDLAGLKDSPSNVLPGFNERLAAWLLGVIEHRCSPGHRGGFFERLRAGTSLGQILEHVTLELQGLAGAPAGFGKTRETSEGGVYTVVIEYEDEAVGRACLAAAHRLLLAAVHDRPFAVPDEVERLRDMAYHSCLGPSGRAIVEAARRRGIPHRRYNAGDLILLGQGHRQGVLTPLAEVRADLSRDGVQITTILAELGLLMRAIDCADRDDTDGASVEVRTYQDLFPDIARNQRAILLRIGIAMPETDALMTLLARAGLESSNPMAIGRSADAR